MGQLDDVKMKLEARLAELNSRVEKIDDELSEPHDDDWSENATESEDEQTLEKVGELAIAEINNLKAALEKIDNGTYGKCSRCEKKISAKRLKALPSASLCIDCA